MGRYLGLDIGKKRIGIANSDPGKVIAFAHSVYELTAIDDFIAFLEKLIREKDIERIIVGLPGRTDRPGDTESSLFARQVAERIEKSLGIETVLYDERLSTVQAARNLSSQGIKQKKQRKIIDMAAAQIILQAYLDSPRR
jgi:putative Holliday junction resolvase